MTFSSPTTPSTIAAQSPTLNQRIIEARKSPVRPFWNTGRVRPTFGNGEVKAKEQEQVSEDERNKESKKQAIKDDHNQVFEKEDPFIVRRTQPEPDFGFGNSPEEEKEQLSWLATTKVRALPTSNMPLQFGRYEKAPPQQQYQAEPMRKATQETQSHTFSSHLDRNAMLSAQAEQNMKPLPQTHSIIIAEVPVYTASQQHQPQHSDADHGHAYAKGPVPVSLDSADLHIKDRRLQSYPNVPTMADKTTEMDMATDITQPTVSRERPDDAPRSPVSLGQSPEQPDIVMHNEAESGHEIELPGKAISSLDDNHVSQLDKQVSSTSHMIKEGPGSALRDETIDETPSIYVPPKQDQMAAMKPPNRIQQEQTKGNTEYPLEDYRAVVPLKKNPPLPESKGLKSDLQMIEDQNRQFDEDFRAMEQMVLLDARKAVADHQAYFESCLARTATRILQHKIFT